MIIYYQHRDETICRTGFMPEAFASGKQTIFWWKGNVTPPKDYKNGET